MEKPIKKTVVVKVSYKVTAWSKEGLAAALRDLREAPDYGAASSEGYDYQRNNRHRIVSVRSRKN